MTYRAIRPLLFRLDPERAHGLATRALAGVSGTPLESLLRRRYEVRSDRLVVSAFGQEFPAPVGVAAGFDKNARVPGALAALGFGHVEVGGVTAPAQVGNPRPRLFRLPEDRALVNRMGLNNDGAAAVGERIRAVATRELAAPIGVNLAKSADVPLADAAPDYRATYEEVADADFFVINVSCPNEASFRELQQGEHLDRIVDELVDAGASPLLIKLSPDLADPAITDVLDVVAAHDLDGVVATNTTTDRPDGLQSAARHEDGGLSGAPLRDEATRTVRFVAQRTDVPVIGVGGVFSAADAYAKIRAGASLVQLYTGLVYRGPSIARSINRGLLDRLERDGFESIEAAVGADLD
jgi:dihydroorotate dehydrogenase